MLRQPDGLPRLLRPIARSPTSSCRSRPDCRITSAPLPCPSAGADELAARFEAKLDDYHAIMMTKALAGRLAEAFAEWLHMQARREWYEPAEHLKERN